MCALSDATMECTKSESNIALTTAFTVTFTFTTNYNTADLDTHCQPPQCSTHGSSAQHQLNDANAPA
jgi:hypothetical protein